MDLAKRARTLARRQRRREMSITEREEDEARRRSKSRALLERIKARRAKLRAKLSDKLSPGAGRIIDRYWESGANPFEEITSDEDRALIAEGARLARAKRKRPRSASARAKRKRA